MYKIKDLNGETTTGSFYEKELLFINYERVIIQNQTVMLEKK